MILAPVLGLELVGWHSRFAVAMPGAIEKGPSFTCPSILGSVVHFRRLQRGRRAYCRKATKAWPSGSDVNAKSVSLPLPRVDHALLLVLLCRHFAVSSSLSVYGW